jgi:hypothetical protein
MPCLDLSAAHTSWAHHTFNTVHMEYALGFHLSSNATRPRSWHPIFSQKPFLYAGRKCSSVRYLAQQVYGAFNA